MRPTGLLSMDLFYTLVHLSVLARDLKKENRSLSPLNYFPPILLIPNKKLPSSISTLSCTMIKSYIAMSFLLFPSAYSLVPLE